MQNSVFINVFSLLKKGSRAYGVMFHITVWEREKRNFAVFLTLNR